MGLNAGLNLYTYVSKDLLHVVFADILHYCFPMDIIVMYLLQFVRSSID